MTTDADPRQAATLDEAARNPDGTYNGAAALSWLSAALSKGAGLSQEEVMQIWREAKARRAQSGQ